MKDTAIVNVYHFYRDFLLYFGNFIDFNVGNIFRKIEYNIQDRTFLYKDFSTELKLPALLIQCSSFMSRIEKNNPLFVNQNYGPQDVFSTVLLVNETKDEYLITTNQYVQFNLDLIINATTQLEALEITQFLNQIFPNNLTFQWEGFTSFLPLPDFILDGWDPSTDDIYYLYEQKLTQQENENITDNYIYYALFEVRPLITSTNVNSYPSNMTSTSQVNISFMVNTFVPVLIYKNEFPQAIAQVVYGFNVHNEPISSINRDLINNIEKKTDYSFYKGIIITSNMLIKDNEKYILDLSGYNINPQNFLFLIRFPDDSYIYTLDNRIIIEQYDSDNDILKYSVKNDLLTLNQRQFFDKTIDNEISLSGVLFKHEVN